MHLANEGGGMQRKPYAVFWLVILVGVAVGLDLAKFRLQFFGNCEPCSLLPEEPGALCTLVVFWQPVSCARCQNRIHSFFDALKLARLRVTSYLIVTAAKVATAEALIEKHFARAGIAAIPDDGTLLRKYHIAPAEPAWALYSSGGRYIEGGRVEDPQPAMNLIRSRLVALQEFSEMRFAPAASVALAAPAATPARLFAGNVNGRGTVCICDGTTNIARVVDIHTGRVMDTVELTKDIIEPILPRGVRLFPGLSGNGSKRENPVANIGFLSDTGDRLVIYGFCRATAEANESEAGAGSVFDQSFLAVFDFRQRLFVDAFPIPIRNLGYASGGALLGSGLYLCVSTIDPGAESGHDRRAVLRIELTSGSVSTFFEAESAYSRGGATAAWLEATLTVSPDGLMYGAQFLGNRIHELTAGSSFPIDYRSATGRGAEPGLPRAATGSGIFAEEDAVDAPVSRIAGIAAISENMLAVLIARRGSGALLHREEYSVKLHAIPSGACLGSATLPLQDADGFVLGILPVPSGADGAAAFSLFVNGRDGCRFDTYAVPNLADRFGAAIDEE
jgi:hypothetical protein